jgi:hypothetical protein
MSKYIKKPPVCEVAKVLSRTVEPQMKEGINPFSIMWK